MKDKLTKDRKSLLDQVQDDSRSKESASDAKLKIDSLLGDTSPSESVEKFMDLQHCKTSFDSSINSAYGACPEASPLSTHDEFWSLREQAANETTLSGTKSTSGEDPLLLGGRPFHPVASECVDSLDLINDRPLQNDMLSLATHQGAQVKIPERVVGGKMIDTQKGLALLVPSENLVQTPEGTAILVFNQDGSAEEPVSAMVADQGGCRDGRHWTPNEDTILTHAVQIQGSFVDWKIISDRFFAGSRSVNSVSLDHRMATATLLTTTKCKCKQRWRKIDPSRNTAAFTEIENSIIIQERSRGKSWSDIAKCLVNRTANQVKFHFEKIDPTRKRGKWSAAEDEFLIATQSRFGNKWAKISEFLPGRSSNDVKNRWSRLRRHYDSSQNSA